MNLLYSLRRLPLPVPRVAFMASSVLSLPVCLYRPCFLTRRSSPWITAVDRKDMRGNVAQLPVFPGCALWAKQRATACYVRGVRLPRCTVYGIHIRPLLAANSRGVPASASRTYLVDHVIQRRRGAGIYVVARIVSDVTHLGTGTRDPGCRRDDHLHARQALAEADVPGPFVSDLLRDRSLAEAGSSGRRCRPGYPAAFHRRSLRLRAPLPRKNGLVPWPRLNTPVPVAHSKVDTLAVFMAWFLPNPVPPPSMLRPGSSSGR